MDFKGIAVTTAEVLIEGLAKVTQSLINISHLDSAYVSENLCVNTRTMGIKDYKVEGIVILKELLVIFA